MPTDLLFDLDIYCGRPQAVAAPRTVARRRPTCTGDTARGGTTRQLSFFPLFDVPANRSMRDEERISLHETQNGIDLGQTTTGASAGEAATYPQDLPQSANSLLKPYSTHLRDDRRKSVADVLNVDIALISKAANDNSTHCTFLSFDANAEPISLSDVFD